MSFVNIGGQTIHTSALSGSLGITGSITGSLGITGSITTTATNGQYLTWGGSTINYTFQKTIYHVLGEDVEVDGYVDSSLAVAISTLNILGKPFYDELKKMIFVFQKK